MKLLREQGHAKLSASMLQEVEPGRCAGRAPHRFVSAGPINLALLILRLGERAGTPAHPLRRRSFATPLSSRAEQAAPIYYQMSPRAAA